MLRSPPPLSELLEESAGGPLENGHSERDPEGSATVPDSQALSEGLPWPAIDDDLQLDSETIDSCANELFASGDILACCPEQAGPILRRALRTNTDEYPTVAVASANPSSAQPVAAAQPEPGLQEWQLRYLQREGQKGPTTRQPHEARYSVAPPAPSPAHLRPSQLQTGQGGSIVAALEAAADHQAFQQQPGTSAEPHGGPAHMAHLAGDASAHFSLHLPVQAPGWQVQQQRLQHGALPEPEHHRILGQQQARPQTQQPAWMRPAALGLRQEANAADASIRARQSHGWQAMQQNRHTQPDLDDPYGWHLTPEPGVPPATPGTWPVPDAGLKQRPESLGPQPFGISHVPAERFTADLQPGSQRLTSSSHQQDDMQLPQELLPEDTADHELLLPRGSDLQGQQRQQHQYQQVPLMNAHVSTQDLIDSRQPPWLQLQTRSQSIGQSPQALPSQQSWQPASVATPLQRGPDLHGISSSTRHQSHGQDAQQQQHPQQHSRTAHQQGISAQRLGNLSSMQRLGAIAHEQQQQQQHNGNRHSNGLPAAEKANAPSQSNLQQQASVIEHSTYGPNVDVCQQQQHHQIIGQPVLHGTWQDGLQQQPDMQPLPHMQLAIQRQQLQQLGAQSLQPRSNAIEHQQRHQGNGQMSHTYSQFPLSPVDSVASCILSSGDPQSYGQQPTVAGSQNGSPSEEGPQRDTLQVALQYLRAKQREAQHSLVPQGRKPFMGSFNQMHGRPQATPAPGDSEARAYYISICHL